MSEEEAKTCINSIEVGSKIQLIKRNGEIVDAVLSSNEVSAISANNYGNFISPEMPPAILVQGKRWGVFRIEIEDIIHIAEVG